MTDYSAHLNESLSLTVTATARSRTNLALHHLFAACRLSARVKQIEAENAGQPFGEFWEEILQCSLGVAMLSVAALESYANEMYFEGAVLKPGINAAAAAELSEIVDKEQILRKYAIALAITSAKRMDMGTSNVQNAAVLIRLRNAVVHFRPEWFDDQDEHGKLSKQLASKFQPSPFLPNEPIFPRAWASHSFTVWALKSTVAFLDHFHFEAALPTPIEQFRTRLSSLSANAL